jgi:ornithine cyclodeaminase/alanine dehydrogenase-like protein (mu-crystallin family)
MSFVAVMPVYVPAAAALGAKLVTAFSGNAALDLPTHLAVILLFSPETGALLAVLGGNYITEARIAALAESGDVVMGIQERRFTASNIVGELGELLEGKVEGRRTSGDVTIFKSLGLAVEDVAAADLAYRRTVAREVGRELDLWPLACSRSHPRHDMSGAPDFHPTGA